jgi:hypothetical protein
LKEETGLEPEILPTELGGAADACLPELVGSNVLAADAWLEAASEPNRPGPGRFPRGLANLAVS